jgi:hypothetical protein
MPRDVAASQQGQVKRSKPPEFTYEPQRCAFIGDHVWAICMRQPGGAWERVNCLDKDTPCLGTGCVFTGGELWPFAGQTKQCRAHDS